MYIMPFIQLNKFGFPPMLEMSLNFTKSGYAVKEIHLQQKSQWINIMPLIVEEKLYRYIVLISHVS